VAYFFLGQFFSQIPITTTASEKPRKKNKTENCQF